MTPVDHYFAHSSGFADLDLLRPMISCGSVLQGFMRQQER